MYDNTVLDTYGDAPDQKLTPYQRRIIHVLAWHAGMTQAQIAVMYGIVPQTVSKIKHGDWQRRGYGHRVVGVTK